MMRSATWFLAIVAAGIPFAAAGDDAGLGELSLEDLMKVPIVSASNRSEPLAEAPATVIVLAAEELRERGYTELSQILDDLPGMQVVRPRGVTYFKNYWRGYRNAIGEPFLVLIDGLVMNHLYFNSATVLAAIPISEVERVEVVYGPASAVYGANASMGVIHVITRAAAANEGARQRGLLAAGTADARLIDLSLSHAGGDGSWSVSGRIDDGVDEVENEAYEYSRDRYYTDRRLWGGFLDNENLAGAHESRRRHRAIDLRARWGSIEVGALYHLVRSGYGVEYAADREQSRNLWTRPETGVFLRSRVDLGDGLESSTLVRYRESDVGNDSYEVISFDGTDDRGALRRMANISFWQARCSSWSAYQDFEWNPSDRFSLGLGLKYEQKDLQKAYDIAAGPSVPVDELDAATYPYPDPPGDSRVAQNRITTEDTGGYLLGRYRIGAAQQVHLGIRADRNSRYGTATTLRAGYVASRGRWVLKALYGEAFQEPTPRLLYGGWTGSGSDPNLDPERSSTIEVSASWNRADLGGWISVYRVTSDDVIVSTSSGAKNLGERELVGADLHAQWLGSLGPSRLRAWLYYSHVFDESEKRFAGAGAELPDGEIGDLAHDSLWLGLSARFANRVRATLRARAIGEREAVDSNPIRRVGGYVTADAHVEIENLGWTGLGLAVGLTNAFDRTYFQPGVRGANAGDTPGAWSEDGRWTGSGGYYNSLLAQPGREWKAMLRLTL